MSNFSNASKIEELYLQLAILENSYNEIKDYPSPDDISLIALPKHFEEKMQKKIRIQTVKANLLPVFIFVKKAISIIIFILGISFTILLLNETVRASCQNAIQQIYEKYIHYIFTPYTDVTGASAPSINYIPSGFSVYDQSSNDTWGYLLYTNDQEGYIEIYYNNDLHDSYFDTEHYEILPIKTDYFEGTYYKSLDKEFMNSLLWESHSVFYQINSTLDEVELIKIANSFNFY